MLQREFPERFSAKSGDRQFSSLSVLAQSVGESKILFDVNPESFVPPPKVTSSVLLITKRESIDNPKFESFLKVAFQQPRKRLLKNLSARYAKGELERLFHTLNIAPRY